MSANITRQWLYGTGGTFNPPAPAAPRAETPPAPVPSVPHPPALRPEDDPAWQERERQRLGWKLYLEQVESAPSPIPGVSNGFYWTHNVRTWTAPQFYAAALQAAEQAEDDAASSQRSDDRFALQNIGFIQEKLHRAGGLFLWGLLLNAEPPSRLVHVQWMRNVMSAQAQIIPLTGRVYEYGRKVGYAQGRLDSIKEQTNSLVRLLDRALTTGETVAKEVTDAVEKAAEEIGQGLGQGLGFGAVAALAVGAFLLFSRRR
ncbi:MAG: hypothetical protein OEY28_00135 [Nitrospira sp.]|nr:hypothetical protein [Nitrospira sp.]